MGNFSELVDMDASNWPDQQHVDITPVWGSIRGRAQGTGIALMQVRKSGRRGIKRGRGGGVKRGVKGGMEQKGARQKVQFLRFFFS